MCKSRGCTCWIDGIHNINWFSCCDRHDKRYSNNRINRYEADILLYRCIKQRCIIMASIMFLGVRLFGWTRYE